MIRKHYATLIIGDQPLTVHYRTTGAGPALFLLHPSPLSSAFLEPLMSRLAPHCTLIAPDTPGFGFSEHLPVTANNLAPYAQVVKALAEHLKIPTFAIYGTATGAQIAIETAKQIPERVSGIMLDNAAIFTDEQRRHIMAGYFPDITSRADGGHLATIWQVCHDGALYFPWHLTGRENRLPTPPDVDPARLQVTAMGYLRAGHRCEEAYRAAFYNENAASLSAVEVPVVLVRWAGSILKKYTDQFDTIKLPGNFIMAPCGAETRERWQCLESSLPVILDGSNHDAGRFRQTGMTPGHIIDYRRKYYADTAVGQLCYRAEPGSAPGRIVIHPPGGEGGLIKPETLQPGDVVPDLPGHGSSDGAGQGSAKAIDALAELREQLRLDATAGYGAGMAIAALLDPGASLIGPATRIEDVPAIPDLTPQAGGGHLFAAWYWVKSAALARREQLTPEDVTRAATAVLHARDDAARMMAEL